MSEGKMTKITNQPGVYYRESTTRRFRGKTDRCFYISFKNQATKVWEKIGWISEGYSAQMAANIRAERMRSIRHGEELPNTKEPEITFGKLWEQYDKWLETGKTHFVDDRSRYGNHLRERFETRRLSEITPLELEQLKSDLQKKDLSAATVKHVLVLIRQMINKAISWNLWKGENPIKKIKLPKLNNRRERFLSQEEAALVLKELKNASQQLFEIGLMSLCTGMRAGEIFALKWGHLNLIDGVIHIADPKGGESRKAYINAALQGMLQKKEMGEPGELVFKARANNRSQEEKKDRKDEQIKHISAAFDRAIVRLKFNDGIDDPRQKVCFHTLRHTFASWLAIKGTPILTIKELMGHKSLAMTERYSHLSPDHKRAAASGIDEILNNISISNPEEFEHSGTKGKQRPGSLREKAKRQSRGG